MVNIKSSNGGRWRAGSQAVPGIDPSRYRDVVGDRASFGAPEGFRCGPREAGHCACDFYTTVKTGGIAP